MRFAGCRLDLGARRLFRGARVVPLSPKAFEFLKVLIESRPRAVSKAELLDRVWPGTFVSEASLARVVNEIRTRLGGRTQRGRVVRTLYKYGYAFAAEIEDESPPQTPAGAAGHAITCWLTSTSREFALCDGVHVAGRDPAVEVWLDSPKISRRHARFIVSASRVVVEDLGSKNGTFVSGSRVGGRLALKSGDEIRIGPFTFVFRAEVTRGSTETEIRVSARGGLKRDVTLDL